MTDPRREEIMEQLAKILGSRGFPAGPRVKKFLQHLVMEELGGNGHLLKGTALAMDVFGRDASFDSNNDPVVRIEAVKLRKALDYYYLTDGQADTVYFSIPKGQYRPKFERIQPKPLEGTKPRPRMLPAIGIRAFDGSSSERANAYRIGLPEELALELSRFDHLLVFSGLRLNNAGKETCDVEHQCDYILSGTVREAGSAMRVTIQLGRQSDGLLVWSDRFDLSVESDDIFAIQEGIARQCATKLADAYGIVAEDLTALYSGRQAVDAGVFEALLSFQAHMRTSRSDSLHEFLDLANNAVRDNPSSGLAHALVAIGLLEKFNMGEATLSEIVDTGNGYAERAVSLAPQSQEALFAAAAYALLNGDEQRFNRLVSAAIAANPNGSLMIAMAGSWIIAFGDMEKGAELVQRATSDNPILPLWTLISLSVWDIATGRYTEASERVRNVDARDCSGDWVLIAIAHALAKEDTLALAALNKARELGLDYERYLADLPWSEELSHTALAALRALG